MKYLIRIFSIIALINIFSLYNSGKANAQQQDKYKILSEKVVKKDFVFVANSITPMSGGLRILNDPYDVKISSDSIISYLPYFGKSTEAPLTSADAGIMFTSTKFDYTSASGKKKTWDVDVKFKDQKNTSMFSFIIYDNGEASLNVTSTFRDPVSFRGYIKM